MKSHRFAVGLVLGIVSFYKFHRFLHDGCHCLPLQVCAVCSDPRCGGASYAAPAGAQYRHEPRHPVPRDGRLQRGRHPGCHRLHRHARRRLRSRYTFVSPYVSCFSIYLSVCLFSECFVGSICLINFLSVYIRNSLSVGKNTCLTLSSQWLSPFSYVSFTLVFIIFTSKPGCHSNRQVLCSSEECYKRLTCLPLGLKTLR